MVSRFGSKKLGLFGAVAIVVTASVVGCSSSGASSNPTSSADSGGNSQVAAAKAQVKTLEDVTSPVTLPMPTEPIKTEAGKKVMIISCDQAEVGCSDIAAEEATAAKKLGWNVTVEDGANSTQKESGFILQAIQEKYDAIVMAALNAVDLTSSINAAYAAKIPMSNAASDDKASTIKGKVMDATEQGTKDQPGKDLGSYIIAKSNGKAKVIALATSAFQIVVDNEKGVQDQLTSNCSGCTFKSINQPLSEVGQPGPPTWSSTLTSNPVGSFDFAVAPFDGLVPSMANTQGQTQRTEVSLGSFDTSVATLKLIKANKPSIAEVAPPAEFESWAAVDLVARALAGAKTWDATNLPVRIVDSNNIDKFGSQPYWQPNFDFKAKFEKLWNVG